MKYRILLFLTIFISIFSQASASIFTFEGNVLSIPTPVFHYDAQDVDGDGILYTNDGSGEPTAGSAVQIWRDKSQVLGGSNNASQGTSNQRPLYVSGAINGHPAIVFDGVNDNYDIANNSLINTASNFPKRSIGALFRTGNDIDSVQIIYEEGGGLRGYSFLIADGHVYAGVWNNREWDDGHKYKSVDLGAVEPNKVYYTFIVQDSTQGSDAGNTLRFYKGGALVSQSNHVDPQRSHGGKISLGSVQNDTVLAHNNVRVSGSNKNFLNGQIGEIIHWNEVLTQQNIDDINNYFDEKWSLVHKPNIDLNGLEQFGAESDVAVSQGEDEKNIFAFDAYVSDSDSNNFQKIEYYLSDFSDVGQEYIFVNGTSVSVHSNGVTQVPSANGLPKLQITVSDGTGTHSGKKLFTLEVLDATNTVTSMDINQASGYLQHTGYKHEGSGGNFTPGQRFIEAYITDDTALENDVETGTINVAFQSVDLNGIDEDGLEYLDTYTLGQAGNTPVTDSDAILDTPSSLNQLSLTLKISGVLNGNNEKLFINGTSTSIFQNTTTNTTASGPIPALRIRQYEGYTVDNGKRVYEISENGGDNALTPAEIQAIIRTLEYDHVGTGGNFTSGQRVVEFVAATTDGRIGSSSESIITVVNASGNHAPTIDHSFHTTMNTIQINNTTNQGMFLRDIIEDGNIIDIDVNPAPESVAITHLEDEHGTWQYSLDGTTWNDVDDGSGVSDSRALLLQEDDKIRFIPNTGFSGQTSISIHAWDETAGTVGAYVNISGNGGITPYSSDFEYVYIEVRDVLTLANNIPDQLGNDGVTEELTDFDFTFSSATFSPNTNLTYSASLADDSILPAWLTFDPINRRFQAIASGPSNSDVGRISIKVTAEDNFGIRVSDEFDIEVKNMNDPITDISLSGNVFSENNQSGSLVGQLSSSDIDASDTHTYSLTSGTGDQDNAKFSLSGSELLTSTSFDYESPTDLGDTAGNNTYSVRIRSDDGNGSQYEKVLIINVQDLDDEAPVLTLIGANPFILQQGNTFTDPGATWTDNVDGTGSVMGTGTVDNSVVGTYTYTYNVTDAAGNIATPISRNIRVEGASILINEVAYNPPGIESAAEWFEIFNPSSSAVNIENWTITEKSGSSSSKTFTFPALTIPAGGFIVIVNDTTEFQKEHSSVTPDIDLPGTSYFQLKNSPDDYLLLKDSLGNDIDYVAWENTGAGWDLSAKDFPVCRKPVSDSDTAADWSDECVATPQAANAFNAIPTDISLSNVSIDENTATGTLVGNLTTIDTDSGDSHEYTLVTGSGDDDNGNFSITGSTLVLQISPDYESQQNHSIRLQTNDGKGGIFQKEFIIAINDINLAPTDISLSGSTIDEGNTLGDLIGLLSASDDGEDTNTLIYSTSCDTPGTDDTAVQIIGNQLKAAEVYDYESKSSYNICVRVSDGVLYYDKNFSFTIQDVDEVPPTVNITAPTKLRNIPITDTQIQITDDIIINVADISLSGSLSTSNFQCMQTNLQQVDCTVSIDGSGDLILVAQDAAGNISSQTEANYVIDTLPPNLPNVIVDTSAPYSVDAPQVTFSSLDNVAVDHYSIQYVADDGGAGTGTLTLLDPATNPQVLSLDPQEGIVHTIVVTAYDTAGNSASTTVTFPPIVTFTAPTTLSNTTITDSTVTISAPTGNDLTEITLSGSVSGASLGTCTGAGSDTTDPYATPVTCSIHNINSSGSILISAKDAGNNAVGSNTQSYVIDTVAPTITFIAPTKLKNSSITDTTISVTDDTAISSSGVTLSGTTSASYSSFSCSQTNVTRVDCSISIDSSGDLILDVVDTAGNAVSASELAYIVDTIPPVISLVGSGTLDVEYGSSFTDPGANYSDNVDISGSIVGSGSVNTGIIGTYSLDYNVSDTAGNPATTVTRTVNVVDTTPPLISLIGTSPITLEIGDSYSDAGATYADLLDGTGSLVATGGPVATSSTGSFVLSYNVTDNAGNAASTVTRTVNVVDTTPPVITLLGDDEITLEIGAGTYSESGATALDNLDGDISGNIVIDSSSIDVNTLGTYFVNYDVTDASGNAATRVTRKIIIEDTTPATLSLNGSNPITLEIGDSYSDAGAVFNDNVDGTGSVTAGGDTVTTTGTGIFTLTYNYIDSSGNTATEITRIVNVVDTVAPVISLAGNNPQSLEVGFTYVDSGVTALDNLDGDISSNIVTDTGNIDNTTLGTYTVTYSVTDASGNIGTGSRQVQVVDTTAPVLTLLGNTTETLQVGSVYADPGVFCNDNFDLSCSATSSGSVNTSVLGSYTIEYNAQDTSGNISTVLTRTVNIVDTIAPIITLNGSGTLNIQQGSSYSDLGATCQDNYDSSCIVNSTGAVDTNIPGIYTISYTATDTNGNSATPVERLVIVVNNSSDTDGDGVPDLIEIQQGTNPNDANDFLDTDGDSLPNYTDLDDDGDGSIDSVESSAPNGGDFNNDGIADVLQGNVATIISPVTNQYISLDTTLGGCNLEEFTMKNEIELGLQDREGDYPHGLARFKLACQNPGDIATIKLYFDARYNSNIWKYKKYNSISQQYTDISQDVSYRTVTIGGREKVLASYEITDGGVLDEDGIANGIIVDPAGPLVVQRGSSGEVRHMDVCNHTNGDKSGDYYDGKCEASTQDSVDQNSEDENSQDNVDSEKDDIYPSKYTIKNNFDSCSVVQNIQNPDYVFPESGIFSDESQFHYPELINKFSVIGIVNGYEDGTFGAKNNISRAEFLKVALLSHCYEYRNLAGNTLYKDVENNSWQSRVIQKAESLSMINGDLDEFGNKVFRPNDTISKIEALKILIRISEIKAQELQTTQYKDINVSWHNIYIKNAENLGLFNAKNDSYLFNPNNGMNREDMIDLIYRLVLLYKK